MVVRKAFAAQVAVVGLLARVGAHVHLELLRAGERLEAAVAGVGLLPGVCSHVDHKLSALYKGFVALCTVVGSVPGVDSHMAVKLSRVFKRAIAHTALMMVGLGVGLDRLYVRGVVELVSVRLI